MAAKFFNKFWLIFTAILTVILFIILFPLLLAKYGLVKALLWSCLLPIAMALNYIRGWWISSMLSKQKKEDDSPTQGKKLAK